MRRCRMARLMTIRRRVAIVTGVGVVVLLATWAVFFVFLAPGGYIMWPWEIAYWLGRGAIRSIWAALTGQPVSGTEELLPC